MTGMELRWDYRVKFIPEVWNGDHAVQVEPEGEDEWMLVDLTLEDITYIYDLFRDERYSNVWQVLDVDDRFKGGPGTPDWVDAWTGPFQIWIEKVERVEPDATPEEIAAAIATIKTSQEAIT